VRTMGLGTTVPGGRKEVQGELSGYPRRVHPLLNFYPPLIRHQHHKKVPGIGSSKIRGERLDHRFRGDKSLIYFTSSNWTGPEKEGMTFT